MGKAQCSSKQVIRKVKRQRTNSVYPSHLSNEAGKLQRIVHNACAKLQQMPGYCERLPIQDTWTATIPVAHIRTHKQPRHLMRVTLIFARWRHGDLTGNWIFLLLLKPCRVYSSHIRQRQCNFIATGNYFALWSRLFCIWMLIERGVGGTTRLHREGTYNFLSETHTHIPTQKSLAHSAQTQCSTWANK